MALESTRLSIVIPALPHEVFATWVDGTKHGKMIGSHASFEPTEGGKHSAWDDYISGTNLQIEPDRRIVQSWRAADFPPGAGDSRLEILFEPTGEGETLLTLLHSELFEGGAKLYDQGWDQFYFQPMLKYFRAIARLRKAAASRSKKAGAQKIQKPAAKKPAAKKPAAKKPAAKKPAAKKPTAKKPAAKKPAAKKLARRR